MKRKFQIGLIVISIFIISLIGINSKYLIQTFVNTDEIVIVIDPGHGGVDPGKVGVNNEIEKEINLEISRKLANYLEYQGITVIMTRDEDIGLYSEGSKNKKREDLNNRVKLINNSKANLAISIHQNSFSQEKYKGAQSFYYKSSKEGEKLASYIQESIKMFVDSSNNRKIKPNDSYFLLKQSSCPTVIIECGFLSNYEEAKKLSEENYQDKIAWAIYIGISAYLDNI